jgi:hypothetical protein
MKTDKHKLVPICLSLLITLCANAAGAQTGHAGIVVKLNTQTPTRLRVSLRSSAKIRTRVYKSQLPWGLRDSIILVGVRPNGEYVEQWPIAGDPTPEEVLVKPNEELTGDIDLTHVFKNLDTVLQQSDVHLFWAYAPPKGLGLPKWSGGWVLMPRTAKH